MIRSCELQLNGWTTLLIILSEHLNKCLGVWKLTFIFKFMTVVGKHLLLEDGNMKKTGWSLNEHHDFYFYSSCCFSCRTSCLLITNTRPSSFRFAKYILFPLSLSDINVSTRLSLWNTACSTIRIQLRDTSLKTKKLQERLDANHYGRLFCLDTRSHLNGPC